MDAKEQVNGWWASLTDLDKKLIFNTVANADTIWATSSLKDKNDLMERWGVQNNYGNVPAEDDDIIRNDNRVATITVEVEKAEPEEEPEEEPEPEPEEEPTEPEDPLPEKAQADTEDAPAPRNDGWPEDKDDAVLDMIDDTETVLLEDLPREEIKEIAKECGIEFKSRTRTTVLIKRIHESPGWGED